MQEFMQSFVRNGSADNWNLALVFYAILPSRFWSVWLKPASLPLFSYRLYDDRRKTGFMKRLDAVYDQIVTLRYDTRSDYHD